MISNKKDENGKLPAAHELHQESSTDVETAADAIIQSTRNGKVINTYEAVYEDPSIQKALQEGKDNEARTYIKEKLCKLGLAKEVCAAIDIAYALYAHLFFLFFFVLRVFFFFYFSPNFIPSLLALTASVAALVSIQMSSPMSSPSPSYRPALLLLPFH